MTRTVLTELLFLFLCVSGLLRGGERGEMDNGEMDKGEMDKGDG